MRQRRKILLPKFALTEVCESTDLRSIKQSIKLGNGKGDQFSYHLRTIADPSTNDTYKSNLLPVILDKDSVPWYLGTLYILGKFENDPDVNMLTLKSLADDLGAFKEWLDSHDDPDELLISFPKLKPWRVTYRYRGALKKKLELEEIAASTAKRRMGTVISFYRWLIEENLIEPANDPWEERTYNLKFKNYYGSELSKKVVTTDLSIVSSEATDVFSGEIHDGGKLRPLPLNEQKWIMEAANELGNEEMYLILLFMLLTGARIQTVATLRVRHFANTSSFSKALSGGGEIFKLKAGPGTGIDTKNGKVGVLQIPRPLYEAMHVYSVSKRAQRRREVASGGNHEGQYFFLTQQGSPYYAAKEDVRHFDPELRRRHQKNGGTIRQFLKDRLIPFIQNKHLTKFHFRAHDLRATFGMNQMDSQMLLVQNGVISLNKARTNVMALMWHSSMKTTDLYFDYRKTMGAAYAAVNGYGEQVQEWIDLVMTGKYDREA